jgi:hypothetical protein
MRKVDLSLQEFGFVVATRAALAAGIALLAAGRLSRRDRRRVGRTLLAVGALTTPIAGYLLFGRGSGARG